MIELDHLQVDLLGKHLIEASAGTGKTYAIALLYLRILVELKLEPSQILVVTYTEAATKELRGRIRVRIREALDVLDGVDVEDPLLQALCRNGNGNWSDKGSVRGILDLALKSFDTAAIFTIHGFCLRALQENAFESGSRYDTELVTDQSGLLRDVVNDFWRQSFFSDTAPLLRAVLKRRFSPTTLFEFAKGLVGNPGLKIIPDISLEDAQKIDQECHVTFLALQQIWQAGKNEIHDILYNDKGLGRAEATYRLDLLPGLFIQMDGFIVGNNPFDLPQSFEKFCLSGIKEGTKKTGTPPAHPFFDLCETLQLKVQERLKALCGELILYCNAELPLRKQKKNIRFFDDLLNDLHTALTGERGVQFALLLKSRYPSALIDEFQDTDPVQYDIFKMIYRDSNAPLFLIGDPKQAIYSFRGADIFAYMQAADDIHKSKKYTLTSNWRSTPALLTAFNQIFQQDKNPFIYEQISYHPVKAGREDSKQLLTTAAVDAPLQLWLMSQTDLNVTKARQLVPQAVASEISRLLHEGATGDALLGGQPVMPGDIAVIVRSHRQARDIQQALVTLQVPCILRSEMTIFDTDEARELHLLLQALLDPGHESSVRAALVTDLLGRSGSDIAFLIEDENAWEECLTRFREYHRLWHDRGLMVMAHLLLTREGIRGRLLRYPDGERRLTNLLHCFEVLHGKSHGSRLGMEGLTAWLSERLKTGGRSEEHQIRLETDEKAVKILTVHVSKGLEYPIVFCPFMWGGMVERNDVVTFHDGFEMMKDFGSPAFAAHKKKAGEESLAESLRLLYVAVTRAQYRCYLYSGKITSGQSKSRPETSPVAYLFHASEATRHGKTDLVGSLAKDFLGLTADEISFQLEQLAEAGEVTISANRVSAETDFSPWPRQQVVRDLFSYRKFKGLIHTDWRVTSFTSFVASESRSVELPDRDETPSGLEIREVANDESSERMTVFNFPKGARAGIFMHALFEKLDFAGYSKSTIAELVSGCLELHGYAKEWQQCISEMVLHVLAAPLVSDTHTFSLSDLKQGSWLAELEFFFPLKFIQPVLLSRQLKPFVGQYAAVDLNVVLDALRFKPVQGMVRGFMDMVFEHGGRYYLLDWKSNHMGSRVEAYNQVALKREMERNLYPLQYLLYTVALNNYLALRVTGYDYEKHFGGVYYLFLRGINGNSENRYGIFRDRPPVKLIHALTDALVTVGEACYADKT